MIEKHKILSQLLLKVQNSFLRYENLNDATRRSDLYRNKPILKVVTSWNAIIHVRVRYCNYFAAILCLKEQKPVSRRPKE